ncbi:MAG: response regulator transcription factor [Lachnospiraceae bacterium]|nr:response regulator transcription factor [Lachnospiraceae bacterium]MBD5511060.1 response regulator transcription factor [Lachnospiraceae bacterium]
MALSIAVCDDNETDLQYITDMVNVWAMQGRIPVSIKTFPSAESFLFHYSENKDYDILLLDVEMGALNGIELAKQIRAQNSCVQIVFITGYPDFIAEGYEVSALHYLMKPVKPEKLVEVLNRAADLRQKERPFLLVSSERETIRLFLDDIYYVESQGHYMLIHTEQMQYRVRMTVSGLLEKLDEGFYRCSRSFIVSLRHVCRITKSEVFLENQVSLPLGRGQYDEINKMMIRYLRSI